MLVAEAVGRTLAALGPRDVFGLIGSGNFGVSNALVAGGAHFVTARHEGGAISMADAYAQVSGDLGICTVHQGPGLTNAMTGLTEAAKSRTPLVLVAADTAADAIRSNFRIAQDQLVSAVGAVAERVHTPESAVAETVRAVRRARVERRPVVLMLPLDIQAMACSFDGLSAPLSTVRPTRPAVQAVRAAVDALSRAERPLIIAGRGARVSSAREPLERLAEVLGALLATSAVANGLFAGNPWALGIDQDPDAIGAHHRVDLGIVGDAAESAGALLAEVQRRGYEGVRWRTPELAARIADGCWQRTPYADAGADGRIDPRTLSRELDALLPDERTVAIDSGHFMGYPAMYLRVPDERGFVFTQAFQAVGLGLASAIGAAVARPDRLTVAALGDGGTMIGLADLETVARLGLRMLIVVYNDAAYGAEVHHFGPHGHPLDLVRFPDVDFAAVGRAFGLHSATVRSAGDLAAVRQWLASGATPGMVLDAKVVPTVVAEWLEEAFRGH